MAANLNSRINFREKENKLFAIHRHLNTSAKDSWMKVYLDYYFTSLRVETSIWHCVRFYYQLKGQIAHKLVIKFYPLKISA